MLDFSSIMFSLAMVEAIMTCLLVVFLFSKTTAAGLKEMAGATCASAVGALLAGFGTSIPNYDYIYYGIVCFTISIMFVARSMRRLQGLNPLYSFEISIIILAVSYTYYFTVIANDIFGLATTNAILYALVSAVTARNLFNERRSELILGCRILGYMFIGFFIYQLLKLMARPLVEAMPSLSAQIAIIDYIDVFVAMFMAIGWSFGLVWTSYNQSEFLLLSAKQIAEQQARTDTLTGINNRRAFFEYADIIDEKARRDGHSFVFAMIDIDNFKSINDTLGHDIGDIALKDVASVMSKHLRKTDILGRIGGEEFAVIFPETSVKEGLNMAERIRKDIEEHVIKTPKGEIKLTVSIGITSLEDHAIALKGIIGHSDLALYKAKSEGRNKVKLYLVSDIDDPIDHEKEITS